MCVWVCVCLNTTVSARGIFILNVIHSPVFPVRAPVTLRHVCLLSRLPFPLGCGHPEGKAPLWSSVTEHTTQKLSGLPRDERAPASLRGHHEVPSECYFLNGFKIKALIKVTAEFFLLSFSLPPLKKKITGNRELGLETVPHPSSPHLPRSLIIPTVSGNPSRGSPETW